MQLTEMINQYQGLLERKEALANETKENNKAIEDMKRVIADEMIDNDCPKISVGGYSFSLQNKTIYSKKSEETLLAEGVDFLDTLREQGLGDIIVETVYPKTLQSSVKNLVEEQGSLPEELAAVINAFDTFDIVRRKETNKAIKKAKEN